MLIDLGKCCLDDSDFSFDWLFIRLPGNEDSHKILEELDFGADQTFHYRVTCPIVSHRHIMGKNVVRTIAAEFFFIESSLNM